MWRSSKRFLMVASVALNAAFIGVWLGHAIPAGMGKDDTPSSAITGRIWCPLHVRLDVSEAQWDQIEPRLKEFQQSAQSVCQQVSKLRAEMMDLIAAPDADRAAIAAKQEEIQAGQRRMQGLVIDHLLAEKRILTTEQQKRLFDLICQRSGCDQGGPMLMSGRPHSGVGRNFREETSSP